MDLTHETFVHWLEPRPARRRRSAFRSAHTAENSQHHPLDRVDIVAAVPGPTYGLRRKNGEVVRGADRCRSSISRLPHRDIGTSGVAPTGHRGAAGRSLQGCERLRPEHHHPRDRTPPAIISGPSARNYKPPRAGTHANAARGVTRACSARTRRYSRPSRRPFSNTRTRCSTTSTSMPARCGRGASSTGMVAAEQALALRLRPPPAPRHDEPIPETTMSDPSSLPARSVPGRPRPARHPRHGAARRIQDRRAPA